MQKYMTLQGEIISGEIVNRMENTVTISDEFGKRYLCRIKDQGFHIPAEPSGRKGWRMLDLKEDNRSKESNQIRAIEPNGNILDFRNTNTAAKHYASVCTTIARNCESSEPIRSGALKGYKFERIS